MILIDNYCLNQDRLFWYLVKLMNFVFSNFSMNYFMLEYLWYHYVKLIYLGLIQML